MIVWLDYQVGYKLLRKRVLKYVACGILYDATYVNFFV